jgi:hypothetical protein
MENQDQRAAGSWAEKVIVLRKYISFKDIGPNCESAFTGDAHTVWILANGNRIHVSEDLKHRGGDNPVGGYYVRYENGFESWSPAKAFEEGYTKI